MPRAALISAIDFYCITPNAASPQFIYFQPQAAPAMSTPDAIFTKRYTLLKRRAIIIYCHIEMMMTYMLPTLQPRRQLRHKRYRVLSLPLAMAYAQSASTSLLFSAPRAFRYGVMMSAFLAFSTHERFLPPQHVVTICRH